MLLGRNWASVEVAKRGVGGGGRGWKLSATCGPLHIANICVCIYYIYILFIFCSCNICIILSYVPATRHVHSEVHSYGRTPTWPL